jgi:predicted MFS family arabinose efflux permease
VSLVGDEVRPFALTFAALSLDRSPSSLGLVLSAGTLPQLLMLVLGGWWGDRRQALRTIVAADALRAFVLFGAAAALVQGSASIPLLTAAQAMCGVATAFFEPAAGRLALGLSPSDKLIRTNALIGVAGYTGEVVGPGLAAALLTVGGPAAAVSFDAATFVVSALLLGGVAVPAPVAQRKRPMRPFADVRYALAPPAARAVIAVSGAWALLGTAPILVLGPVVCSNHLDGSASWAAVVAAYGLGGIVGGVLLSRKTRVRRLALLAFALEAPAPFLLALAAPTAAVAVAAVLGGLGSAGAGTVLTTVLQRQTSPEFQAMATAVRAFFELGMLTLGYLLVGVAASALGTSFTLSASAITAAGLAVVVYRVGRNSFR